MKRIITFIVGFCLLISNTYTYANAGPTYWKGYPSYESLTIEEDSQIEVIKEDLIFDFTREEDAIYRDFSIFGRVTAAYTMSNNTKDKQSVQMAFPLVSYFREFRPETVDIRANNEAIAFKVYIGGEIDLNNREEESRKEMDFASIIESINSAKYSPKHYSLDEIGCLYSYDVSSKDGRDLNIALSYDYNSEKTKVISKGFNGIVMEEDSHSLTAWIRGKESLEVFVLGEDINIDFKAYLDGEMKDRTEEYSLDISTKRISLNEYLTDEFENFEEEVPYLEYLADDQLFNLVTKLLDKTIENNVGYITIEDLLSFDHIGRFFILVYEVDFQSNSTSDISISYMSKGTMDRRKTREPVYTFDYILNPASNWASFKDLNIKVIPPKDYPYIIDASLNLSRNEDGTYIGSYQSLPDKDLSFSLYYKEEIRNLDRIQGYIQSNYYFIIFVVTVAILLVLGVLVVFLIKRMYKRYRK